MFRIILALCVLGICCTRISAQNSVKVVGGSFTNAGTMPYMVSISRYGNRTCGGSLLTKKCVLTAAHCVKDYPANVFSVKAGTTSLNEVGITSSVARIHHPPDFSLSDMNRDVAVLELADTLDGPNIGTVRLPSTFTPANTIVTVAGWGRTTENGPASSNLLQADLNTISNRQCANQYRAIGMRVTDAMMCTSTPGKDACQGDSGGPLMRGNTQVGIVSWGIGCASPYPGVFTDVRKVRDYIDFIKRRFC